MNRTKVLHVIGSLCVGGIESATVNLCNGLNAEKYEVFLFILSDTDLTLKSRLYPHIKLIVLPRKYHPSALINTLNLFFWMLKIISIFSKIKPNILHTHLYQYIATPVLISILLAKSHIIHFHTIHAAGIHYEKKTYGDKIKLGVESFFYYMLNTRLICVSRTVLNLAIKNLSGFVDLRIIVNGIDLNIFTPPRHSAIDQSQFRLVYVSRLYDGKNHITILRALNILQYKYPNIQLALVGDGPKRDDLESYVTKHGLSESVSFLGNRGNVAEVLSDADVGVFPSEHEGDGIALTEMMAMGLAVIGSDIEVVRNKFESPGDAIFFSVFDHEELARKIESLYLDRPLLKKLQIRAYENSRLYSIDAAIKKYEAYYATSRS